MTEQSGEVFIDFTNEDVLTLTEILDLDPPPGVGVESLEELAVTGDVDRLRHASLSSLRTRGIIEGNSDSPEVVDAVAEIVRAFGNPGAMVAAASETDGVMETRFYAAMPEIAVEHRGLSISLHRFIPFATRDLLARVLRFVDLRPYTPDAAIGFSVEEPALQSVADQLERQDRHAAVGVLTDSGVEAQSAEAFVTALTMKRTSTSVTILHRPEQDTVEGGALSWLDAGMSGLWVTETDEESEDLLEVKLVDAKSVVRELLSYLPDAFDNHGLTFPSVDA